MSDVRDIVSSMIETVSPNLEDYIQASSIFSDIVKGSEKAVQVSRYGWRHPIKLYMGGASAKVSANGGSAGVFPVGTMMNITHIVGAYFTGIRSYRIPDEAIDATSTEGQARVRALGEQIADAMEGQGQEDDIALHTSGTGILTNNSSAPVPAGGGTASTTLTFGSATDYLRTARLRVGMSIDIWSSDLTTKRTATQPLQIIAMDPSSGVVTLNQSVTVNNSANSPNGDVITFVALDAYGPSTPVSFQSTYPQLGASFPQYGIGGDSWRHGLPYANDVTTTNYFFSRLKSTRPEFLCNRVNGNGNALDWAVGRIGQDKVTARFGTKQDPGNLVGLANTAQFFAIENLDIAASKIDVTGNKTTSTDLAAFQRKAGRSVSYCGVQFYLDPRMAQDRLDTFAKDCIYKIQLHPTQFVDGGDSGKNLFRVRASGGQPTSELEFYVKSAFDYAFTFPGKQFYADNLQVDSRYVS
jgi:hypothetical protein